jgi:hypothetical protein
MPGMRAGGRKTAAKRFGRGKWQGGRRNRKLYDCNDERERTQHQ